MTTFNGSRFVGQSVDSVLAQTLAEFELIIVDDCSTDDTGDVLSRITDSRVKVMRNSHNMGVVQSRNRCLELARADYIAMLDHDDLSRPTRLAKQLAYFETHPDTVLLGTAAHTLTDGVVTPTRHPPHSSASVIRWLLHVANPLICSSIMFRAASVRSLGTFMREGYKYADDYDLYHRMMEVGEVGRLDEPLTLYRLHAGNAFRRHEDIMLGNAVKVLAPAYEAWFGDQAKRAAGLVVHHLAAGHAVPDAATLGELEAVFERVGGACIANRGLTETDRATIKTYGDELWRRMLRATAANGAINITATRKLPPGRGFSFVDTIYLAAAKVPVQRHARNLLRAARPRAYPPRQVPPGRLYDATYEPLAMDDSLPPTMFVVIDTEAEFDWDRPFARHLTSVTAMDNVERGQEVFDAYGLRPIYVVDFPIASQTSSINRLRTMLDRDACYVGAHLHPWTTPPFEEQPSSQNSFPGNLAAELEEQKLIHLLQTIRDHLDVTPLFYKAGRYGIGPATASTLVRHGIKVDFSVLPGTNLVARGGPDFRRLEAHPYWADDGRLLSIPMTRSRIGLLPSMARLTPRAARQKPDQDWHWLQPALSRLHLAETITLTPEGVTQGEQIRLLKSMLRSGKRLFVMHYHSPSLSPGHTPYVRTADDLQRFVQCIRDVCRFFFEEAGGLPGYPPDLLTLADRKRGLARGAPRGSAP